MKKNLHLLTLVLPILWAACGGPEPEAAAPSPAIDSAVQTVLDSRPSAGEPESIPEVRVTAEPGRPVLLEGRIMGVMHPFVENRAVFVLGDNATLTACGDNPGDTCSTPWDACCDPVDIRQAGTATIQIVDADGRVVHQGLEGVNGLEKLATVRVAGTLAPAASPGSLVVNATAIDVVHKALSPGRKNGG